jgi:hypothetical protein
MCPRRAENSYLFIKYVVRQFLRRGHIAFFSTYCAQSYYFTKCWKELVTELRFVLQYFFGVLFFQVCSTFLNECEDSIDILFFQFLENELFT